MARGSRCREARSARQRARSRSSRVKGSTISWRGSRPRPAGRLRRCARGILFPVARMRNVNRGRLDLRTFDPVRDFAEAESVAAAVRGGKNPFATRPATSSGHYMLASAGEIMPYRLYVPTITLGAQASYPLSHRAPWARRHGGHLRHQRHYGGVLPKLPEQHGYIVAAPSGIASTARMVGARQSARRSGNEARSGAQRRRRHASAAVGAAAIPDRREPNLPGWPLDGRDRHMADRGQVSRHLGGAWTVRRLGQSRHTRAPPPRSTVRGARRQRPDGERPRLRAMVEKAKDLGIDVTYVEVPGGGHSDVVAPHLPGMFEFFNAHKKSGRATSQP